MITSGMLYILGKKGFVHGNVTLEFSGRITPEDILSNFEEVKLLLGEIISKGFRYFYIETEGKYFVEVDLTGQECSIYPLDDPRYIKNPRVVMSVEMLAKHLPDKVKIKEVTKFKINISTDVYPRAVTVDLAKNVILYIHETFWNWKDEWVNDQERLSQALKIYEIVKWLLEEKMFKLHEDLNIERCKSLLEKFEKLKIEKNEE
ncbi:MAG: hypothetical protein QXI58_04640 [Candidatus Micrarchaeia archaeon]